MNNNEKQLRLYDIPRGSKIKCDCSDGSTYITFNKLDGMYSHCTTEKGGTTHLRASAPLKKEGDYYIIDSDDQ